MNLAVVGSRNFVDKEFVFQVLDVYRQFDNLTAIVSGGATGADSFAEEYAEEYRLLLKVYHPRWDEYGKAAGFRRNKRIWSFADEGVAFWNGFKSKGTEQSFSLAMKHNKKLLVFKDRELVKYFTDGQEVPLKELI